MITDKIECTKGVCIVKLAHRKDYYLRIYLKDKKKNIFKSFNTANRDECILNWLQLYTDFMQSDDFKEREKKKLSIVKLTQQYELHMMERVKRGQIKQSSAEASLKMMKRITKWIKKQSTQTTDKVERDTYKRFGDEMLNDYKPKTVNGDVVQFNNYLSWLAEEGHISRDDKPTLKKVKDRTRYNVETNPAFTGVDYKIFIETFNRYEIGDGKDRDDPDEYQKWWNRRIAGVFVRMMYYSGARPHELLKMNMRDIEAQEYKLPNGEMTMRGLLRIPYATKTGFREAVINGWVVKRLIDHLRAYNHPRTKLEVNDETPIFVNPERGVAFSLEMFRDHIQETLRLCNLDNKKYTIYSLRSTYITEMLLRGANIDDIARNVGNSAETIRKHYDNVQNILKSDELLKMNKHFMRNTEEEKL